MPEIKWIKLTTDMFDDEKIRLIEAMPDADTLLVIWVKLLCQAGKNNAGGYIYISEGIPYTVEDLATVLNRPLNTIRLALNTFTRLRMIEVSEEGHIYLPNWERHQSIERLLKIRNDTRLRVQKHRNKTKLLAEGVTRNHPLRNATEEEEEEEEEEEKKKNRSSRRTTGKIFTFYQDNQFGILNDHRRTQILDLIDAYGDEFVLHAFHEAERQGKRRMSYVEGILKKGGSNGEAYRRGNKASGVQRRYTDPEDRRLPESNTPAY